MTDQADMEARARAREVLADQYEADDMAGVAAMLRVGGDGHLPTQTALKAMLRYAAEREAAAYARAAEVARGRNVIEAMARAICEADGYDPDDDVIAGQAAAFENYGPRWQAMQRSEGQLGTTDYVAFANAALAALPKLNEAIAEARAQAFNEAAELSRGMILYDAETIANAIEALGEAKG